MAYAQKSFNVIQLSNPENTPGTAEAATEKVFGTLTQKNSSKVFFQPEQDRGTLSKNVEVPFQVSEEVELDLEGSLYDRLAVFAFCNAIRGNITATRPDVLNEPLHYLWTIEPGLTTGNTPDITNGIDTFTVEWGDNVGAFEMEYGFTISLELSGAPNEDVKFSWTMGGRQISDSTLTAALVAPTAAYFPQNKTKFYIDTSYAGIGGTQKTGMLRAWKWKLDTMFKPLFAADGTYYFTSLSEEPKAIKLELTYYRDGTNYEAERTKWNAQTTTYLRIALDNGTEMDVGQSNPPYIYLDGAFRYTEWPEIDEENGINVATVTLESVEDSTASKQFGVSVGTTMSAFA